MVSPTKKNQYDRDYRLRNKKLVLEHYGGVCTCCGESRHEFLTMDHIDGGGTIHRATIATARTIYLWLKMNNFPPGFQILCANCNTAKAYHQVCPHQRESSQIERIAG